MTKSPPDSAADFAQLVQMQELFFEAETTLAALQASADKALADLLKPLEKQYVDNKVVRDQAEAAIKALAVKHPEWKTGQTIRTPFGTVEFRKSTKTTIASEVRTIEAIKALKDHPEEFLNTTVSLDIEALERLDDDVLALLGVERMSLEKVTVKRAQIELGKASDPATVKIPKKKGKAA